MTPLKGKKYESILFERHVLKSNYILILKNRKNELLCLICKSIPGILNIVDNMECQNMK